MTPADLEAAWEYATVNREEIDRAVREGVVAAVGKRRHPLGPFKV